MHIRWTQKARENLISLEEFIRKDKPKAAIAAVIKVVKTVEILSDHPHMGRMGRVPGTRELVIAGTPFIAVYQIQNDSIDVIRVLHAARTWPELFEKHL